MNTMITGDWHLRFKRPKHRKDLSYFDTQFGKVEWLLNLAAEYDCAFIAQPGDFFDGADIPYFVVRSYIDLINSYDIPILCTRGQHDLRYHSSNISNTPLAVMEAAGVVTVVDSPIHYDDVTIYGCPFEGVIPKVEDSNGKNILLIHKMIVREKIWKDQVDFVYGNKFLEENPEFNLIVSGDNHESFAFEDNDNMLLNCGSLMRSRIDQRDHRPVCYIYDTETGLAERHYLEVQHLHKVFNFDNIKREAKISKDLELFIHNIEDHIIRGKQPLNYTARVVKVMEDMGDKLNVNTKAIIRECLGWQK